MSTQKHLRGAIIAFTLVTTLASSGCKLQQKLVIDTLTAALQNLKDSRELMETYGRDIKKRYSADQDAFKAGEARYEAARAAFTGYLSAMKVAALTGEKESATIASSAQDVVSASVEFLSGATHELDPTLNTRKIPFARALTIPSTIPIGLYSLSLRDRQMAVRAVQEQATWAPWSEL